MCMSLHTPSGRIQMRRRWCVSAKEIRWTLNWDAGKATRHTRQIPSGDRDSLSRTTPSCDSECTRVRAASGRPGRTLRFGSDPATARPHPPSAAHVSRPDTMHYRVRRMSEDTWSGGGGDGGMGAPGSACRVCASSPRAHTTPPPLLRHAPGIAPVHSLPPNSLRKGWTSKV
jgi:hypothetical protein